MHAPVMIVDSGSGGFSVLQAIKQRLPHAAYSYVADYAGLPYGAREAADISQRISELVAQANARRPHCAVVVACNTASTITLERLRSELSIPVIGVVPAIKPACEAYPQGRVLLLATPRTVAGAYLDRLIAQFSKQTVVERYGSTALVNLTEKAIGGEDVRAAVGQELASFAAKHFDAVVLGCTHFPLIRSILSDVFNDAELIDSAEAIARRLEALTQGQIGGGSDNWFLATQWPHFKPHFLADFAFSEYFSLRLSSQ